ncbi:hypothetical protein HRI_000760100 [Hibiscus trionum]|uniref:Retrotransposon gag domain-containing protein n=1 Tax=Hibiscus trionum TaxID=183268 RepID=A0A9W7LNB1_HIBTR|nr:hypothetical protein HRI_000760100 [Hibiscus trionum]
MEERLAKVEKGQKDLESRLDGVNQNISDQIAQSHVSIIAQMTSLLAKMKGKEGIPTDSSHVEDHEGVSSHARVNPEGPKMGKKVFINLGGASASRPGGVTTSQPVDIEGDQENEVPDLSLMEEVERLRVELEKKYEEKFRLFEEKLRNIQEVDEQGNNASDLSLVVDLVLPPKFKVPDFDKYDGTTCPSAHITMYCRKMAAFVKDEKLLIHCFQDNLTGSAIRWYTSLSRENIKTWKDLSRAFVDHYKHVIDMTPNRIMLEGMEQRVNESLRQYAQRWRDVAAQIQPAIPEHEITPMFINTLKGALFDRLINNTTQRFADMVKTGESIEVAIKSGRIDSGESHRKSYKKKENEVNTVNTYTALKSFTLSAHQATSGGGQSSSKREIRPPKKENEKMNFTLIPMSYADLYTHLYEAELVRPYHVTPFKPPFPAWYDENANYEYHGGVLGHTIENCIAFKKFVQRLIKTGVLQLDEPNTTTNPLPNHAGRGVNAIEEQCTRKAKTCVSKVRSPLQWVFQQLCMARLIDRGMVVVLNGCGPYCEYHQQEGHDIQCCEEFKQVVQELMNSKEIEFFEGDEESRNLEVCASDDAKVKFGLDRPFVIPRKTKEKALN